MESNRFPQHIGLMLQMGFATNKTVHLHGDAAMKGILSAYFSSAFPLETSIAVQLILKGIK